MIYNKFSAVLTSVKPLFQMLEDSLVQVQVH